MNKISKNTTFVVVPTSYRYRVLRIFNNLTFFTMYPFTLYKQVASNFSICLRLAMSSKIAISYPYLMEKLVIHLDIKNEQLGHHLAKQNPS